jgi:hypothetical protein
MNYLLLLVGSGGVFFGIDKDFDHYRLVNFLKIKDKN